MQHQCDEQPRALSWHGCAVNFSRVDVEGGWKLARGFSLSSLRTTTTCGTYLPVLQGRCCRAGVTSRGRAVDVPLN